ncbi:MAG: hypothetical protein EAZ92_00840 [Candidatus Kapaibacterium sp.]|nr:MAG: hypothetical protein EAZ92_00840 [Candidatus Kapabacteria bacterium]
MGILRTLDIVKGDDQIAASIFENLAPHFLDVAYSTPSEYVSWYWKKYQESRVGDDSTNNVNGKVFEYILATLLVREEILPIYLSAHVAFVPNVIYDIMLYTAARGPICLSAKTSLRERYKQADLEAIALKYVHRKSLSYLITMNQKEANSVNQKISTGDVIGLDEVIFASSERFDNLISELKKMTFTDSPTVQVITSNQIVTADKVQKLMPR